ncbi:MAG TPA: PDZ domain-containing protein [Stellaceae bacterium]|jgi:hypothetical protein
MPLQSGKLSAVAGLLLALGACASPADVPGAQPQLQTDEFSKTVDIVGPEMVENPFFGMKKHYDLLSRLDKRSRAVVVHLVEITLDYNGNFIYFRYANDDTAQSLRLIPARRTRNIPFGMDRREEFTIAVPDATLRAHVASGYRIKLSAQDGRETILSLTPAMVADQIAAVDNFRATGTVVAPVVTAGPAGGTPTAAPAAVPSPRATTPDGKPLLGLAPFDLPFGVGVQVNRVDPNTPAEAAGFQVGDLLVRYNGQPVTGADQFRNLIVQTAPGSRVPIEITRHGAPMTLSAQM